MRIGGNFGSQGVFLSRRVVFERKKTQNAGIDALRFALKMRKPGRCGQARSTNVEAATVDATFDDEP